MGPLARSLAGIVLAGALPALACDYPDEGNMPLRRAVSRVQYLPEVEAWSQARHQSGEAVQYLLRLQETRNVGERCYWTLDVIGAGKVWQRFYVSPDGYSVLAEDAGGGLIVLDRWRQVR